MILIHSVKPNMVEIVWPDVVGYIDSACEHSNGELDSNVILSDLIDDKVRMVLVKSDDVTIAAITFKISQFNTGKRILSLMTVSGTDMSEWIHDFDKVANEIGKGENCSEIYIIGRPGWDNKLLRSVGFSKIHTTISKKVA